MGKALRQWLEAIGAAIVAGVVVVLVAIAAGAAAICG
jgi:hypothetical protein